MRLISGSHADSPACKHMPTTCSQVKALRVQSRLAGADWPGAPQVRGSSTGGSEPSQGHKKRPPASASPTLEDARAGGRGSRVLRSKLEAAGWGQECPSLGGKRAVDAESTAPLVCGRGARRREATALVGVSAGRMGDRDLRSPQRGSVGCTDLAFLPRCLCEGAWSCLHTRWFQLDDLAGTRGKCHWHCSRDGGRARLRSAPARRVT